MVVEGNLFEAGGMLSMGERAEQTYGRSFLLAGRAWMVERIDHRDRIVVVRDAPRGRKPT
jgi:hypothetical protein